MKTTYTADTAPSGATTALAIASLAIAEPTPLSITPVIHPRDGVPDDRSRTFWSATANAMYIVRQQGEDIYGKTPDLSHKLAAGNDLIDHGRRGPVGCDHETIAGLKLWQAADIAGQSDRPSAPVAHHIIAWLPTNMAHPGWRDLTLTFLDREITANGMIADWAIHTLTDEEGRWIRRPHLHAVTTSRFWKSGRRTGEPNPAWLWSVKQQKKLIQAWDQLCSRY